MALQRKTRALAVVSAAAVLAAGCSSGNAGEASGDDGALTFWTLESEPNRVARTEANLQIFTEQTGIEVDLVTVDEASVAQSMMTNAASGTLPDVVDHPMVMTPRWASEELLDTEAAGRVMEALGEETFSESALEFATVDDEIAAVPTSGWGMLMHYRTDLFDAAGLEPPETLDAILEAARTLHDPGSDMNGIALASDPGHQVTQQIFEQFALSNGCNLINDSGELEIDSDRCVEVFDFYAELLNNYAPTGTIASVEQRALYLAGQAAMLPQGPFTLHRLANLEDAEPAVCEQCTKNPAYLAENTGIVSVLTGFHGDSAQYGRTNNLGITVDADTEAAEQLVEYLLSDGYVEWLAQVPNGMIPTRLGTVDEPRRFVDSWQDLNMGVDREGTLVGLYGEQVVDQLIDGAQKFDAWGIRQGYGALTGVLYELYTVPAALREVAEGDISSADAAEQVRTDLETELELLG